MQHIFDLYTRAIISVIVYIFLPFTGSCKESEPAPVKNARRYLAQQIEISIPECEELYNINSHGGLLGDGDTQIILQFTEENAQILVENITANEHWRELPLDWFTDVVFYGKVYDDRRFGATFDCEIPEIHEGYWFAYNKQTEEYSLDYETFREASSRNYYISVYDSKEMKLYYYNLDT